MCVYVCVCVCTLRTGQTHRLRSEGRTLLGSVASVPQHEAHDLHIDGLAVLTVVAGARGHLHHVHVLEPGQLAHALQRVIGYVQHGHRRLHRVEKLRERPLFENRQPIGRQIDEFETLESM